MIRRFFSASLSLATVFALSTACSAGGTGVSDSDLEDDGTGVSPGETPSSGGSAAVSPTDPVATGGSPGADGTGGAPAATGGGTSAPDSCVPDAGGTLVIEDDIVLDETTCLTWMKGGIASAEMVDLDTEHVYPQATYWDAEIACDNLVHGGYEDWRVPSLDEIQSILTDCQNWSAANVPWSIPFDDVNMMLWTSLPVATKYCSIDVQGGGVATSSPSSGPGVRCVRGTGTVGSGATCSGCPL